MKRQLRRAAVHRRPWSRDVLVAAQDALVTAVHVAGLVEPGTAVSDRGYIPTQGAYLFSAVPTSCGSFRSPNATLFSASMNT